MKSLRQAPASSAQRCRLPHGHPQPFLSTPAPCSRSQLATACGSLWRVRTPRVCGPCGPPTVPQTLPVRRVCATPPGCCWHGLLSCGPPDPDGSPCLLPTRPRPRWQVVTAPMSTYAHVLPILAKVSALPEYSDHVLGTRTAHARLITAYHAPWAPAPCPRATHSPCHRAGSTLPHRARPAFA